MSTEILQARILEWLPCPPPGDLPNPGTEPRSPTLQVNSLPSEPPGSPTRETLRILLFFCTVTQSPWKHGTLYSDGRGVDIIAMHSHQKCASLPLKSFSSLELSFVTHPPSTVLAHHFGSQDLPPSCLFLSLPPRLCSGVNFTSICPLQQFPHTSTLGCQSYAMSLLPRQGNQSEVAILFPSG